VHLLADWNAVLATTDRASGADIRKTMPTAFVLKAGAHSLDAHNPARPPLSAQCLRTANATPAAA
jgi:hypothetical protein